MQLLLAEPAAQKFTPPVWHSKKSDEHPTPQKVFDDLDK